MAFNHLRKKLLTRIIPRRRSQVDILAIPNELRRVVQACLHRGVVGLPVKVVQALVKDSALDSPTRESRFLDLFGEYVLEWFDELGPVYGKAGQMALTRLSPHLHEVAKSLRLTRLYKDWPPIPFSEVTTILDREIPRWRTELRVESHPIGVASIAQVHAAEGRDGKRWVIKIIKPQAARRMLETAAALDQLVVALEPLAVTLSGERALKELKELVTLLRRELQLDREKATIDRARVELAKRRQKVMVVPEVFEELSTRSVLVIERFDGVSFADVVDGSVKLSAKLRQKLARQMLSELLVQVFEWGLFHGDPHAGNLILRDDGSVGIFDWGLVGELLESDRQHIAAILKAVMALDQEQLVDALISMAAAEGKVVERAAVRKELKTLIALFKKSKESETKPSMQSLFESCLRAAARLGIEVPQGLLMMVKSLVTIEGLAKGIDPTISMARIATPVLFRAARPSVADFFAMGKRLPQLTRMLFS